MGNKKRDCHNKTLWEKECDHQKTTHVITLEEEIEEKKQVNLEHDNTNDPENSRAEVSTMNIAIPIAS